MSIIIFIIILLVLIVGHEFGHLIIAKLFGMKVPEFGVGFPPRLWGKKIGETEYTLNAIPFGGFVKIHGEDVTEGERTENDPASFFNRPKYAQAGTLFAGPFMNILIAILLSSVAFMAGVPASTDSGYPPAAITDAHVLVVEIIAGSPSEKAGIRVGDRVVSLSANGKTRDITKPEEIPALVQSAVGSVAVSLLRADKPLSVTLNPAKGIVPGEPDRLALGVATAEVGTLRLSFFQSFAAGFHETAENVREVFLGIISLIGSVFTFSASLSGVSGPVGIANLVGNAATFGFGSLLSFAALISVNLGIINLFPFPALDGGRLALLLVEAVSGRRVPARVANALNTLGFALLIALMLVVTVHDIVRLIG